MIADIFKNPAAFAGQTITVAGWVKTARAGKEIAFLSLNDGGFDSLQAVLEASSQGFAEGARLGAGAAVEAEGVLTLTPGAPQPFELKASRITVLGECPPEYPIQKKRHTLEFLRTLPHLRHRTNLLSAVFRVRSEAAFAVHDFFHRHRFVYVHTPIITGSDCEGAGEMFTVTTLPQGAAGYTDDFFGKHVGLTVSGQLMGEAYAHGFGRIYTFGPTFRAENSNTARHAAEFWMIEPEIAFCDLAGDMQWAEDMLKHIVKHVMDACPGELAFFNQFVDKTLLSRLEDILNKPFARITYTQAVELLQASGKQFAYPVSWGADLQTEHERYITEEALACPVFVTDYPKDIKAFYMKQNPDGKTVAAMDLLVPGVGEIIGGSQREEDIALLSKRIEEMGMDKEGYQWYLDIRRFGGTVHAGFGLGFERLLMYITGVQNIRDVIPFPRTTGNCDL